MTEKPLFIVVSINKQKLEKQDRELVSHGSLSFYFYPYIHIYTSKSIHPRLVQELSMLDANLPQ